MTIFKKKKELKKGIEQSVHIDKKKDHDDVSAPMVDEFSQLPGEPSEEEEDDDDENKKSKHQKLIDFLNKKYNFRYNTIKQVIEYRPRKGKKFVQYLKDRDGKDVLLAVMDAGFGSSISKLMEDLIQSRRVSIDYNPFKDYFDSLEWDGKDHLSRLANTITILNEGDQTQLEDGKQPADYWVEMFTSWMAHSIACTLSEGYFINDVVLVLQSKQGKFKTTWLNRLCPKALHPDYIYTGHIVPALTDKVTAGHLVTRFILNLDDQLESIHNKDFNAIKSIISTKDVPLRKAFAKDDYDRKRICNFVASVNNARILQDNENRRYMCFKIDSIDLSVDVNIDQCWAQAKHIYQSKDNWYWSSEERDIIRKLNELFTSINPEEEFLQQLFTPALPNTTGVKYYSVSEIIRVINKYAGHPIVKNNGHGLKSRLTKMGFSDPIMKRLAGAKYGTYVIPVLEKFYISEKDGHIFFPDSSNTNSQLNADANHSVIEREIEETTPF